MRVRSLLLLVIVLIISANTVFSQPIASGRDTVYIIRMYSTLENGRPINSSIIAKKIEDLVELSRISDRDSFVCKLFSVSTVYIEPFLTLVKNIDLYNFRNAHIRDKFFRELSIKVENSDKMNIKLGLKNFDSGHSITFSCVKVVASFWQLKATDESLNGVSHQFYIKEECYDSKYVYNLRDLEKTLENDLTNIRMLQKTLGL